MAVAGLRHGTDAWLSGDMATYADVLADEFSFEDRRSGLQLTLGKREAIEQARATAELQWERADTEVLETRGDNSALCRQTWHVEGFEAVFLVVLRVDASGKTLVSIVFEDEDLDAARAELEVQSDAR